MVLDIILFRADQGGDPDKIRELQRKRFKDVAHVDAVIDYDDKWRKCKRNFKSNLLIRCVSPGAAPGIVKTLHG